MWWFFPCSKYGSVISTSIVCYTRIYSLGALGEPCLDGWKNTKIVNYNINITCWLNIYTWMILIEFSYTLFWMKTWTGIVWYLLALICTMNCWLNWINLRFTNSSMKVVFVWNVCCLIKINQVFNLFNWTSVALRY